MTTLLIQYHLLPAPNILPVWSTDKPGGVDFTLEAIALFSRTTYRTTYSTYSSIILPDWLTEHSFGGMVAHVIINENSFEPSHTLSYGIEPLTVLSSYHSFCRGTRYILIKRITIVFVGLFYFFT